MTQTIQTITERFTKDFAIIQWIVYIFIGSAITAFATEIFVDNYFETYFLTLQETSSIIATRAAVLGIGLLAILFTIPLVLSLMLTKLHPQKRLVPPLIIQILSFGWLLIYSYNRGFLSGALIVYLIFFGGYYVFIAGTIQDFIMVKIFGRLAEENNILSFSYRVSISQNDMNNLLNNEKYRKNFGFGLIKSKNNSNGDSIYKTSKATAPQVTVMVSKGATDESVIHLAVYGKDRYSLKSASSMEEYAQKQNAYLKCIASRANINLIELPRSAAKAFIDTILANLRGSTTLENFVSLSWVKFLAVSSIVIISAIGSLLHWWGLGEAVFGAIVPIVILILFELREDKLTRKGTEL